MQDKSIRVTTVSSVTWKVISNYPLEGCQSNWKCWMLEIRSKLLLLRSLL